MTPSREPAPYEFGLTNEDGRIFGGPLPLDQWPVYPDTISLVGDALAADYSELHQMVVEYGPPGQDKPTPWKRDTASASPALLDRFVALSTASPEKILRFAKRYGTLGLCEHGVPASHLRRARKEAACAPLAPEPLKSWRELSHLAGAVLNLAAAVHDNSECRLVDWAIFVEGLNRFFQTESDLGFRFELKEWKQPPKETLTWLLSGVVTMWIHSATVQPALSWNYPDPPTLLLDCSAPLFAAIGMLMAGALSKSAGIAVCSGCGRVFNPKVQARRGKRRYCTRAECRRARARDATRDHRQRQRKERAKRKRK